MQTRTLHLHSMVVHAVIALAALGAGAFVLEARAATVAGIAPPVWAALLRGALGILAVLALPATLTGIAERNHMYATWHSSHRAKLALSLLLVTLAAVELVALADPGRVALRSPLAAAVVLANPAVCFLLSFYGLRITLGRQGLGRPSYVPDMDRQPPIDILVATATVIAEPAKVVELQEEAGA